MAVAQLGLAVDSRQAASAVVDLDKLAASAGKADAAATALASGAKKGEAATSQLGTATRNAATAANASASAFQRSASAIILEGTAADTATSQMMRLNRAMNDNASTSRELAFQRRNLSFQLFDISQSLALGMPPLMVALQQGPQIAQIWGANEGGVGRAIAESAAMLGRFAVALAPVGIAAAAVGLVFAGVTREINESGKTQVTFWQTLVATAEVSAEAIMRALDPVWKGIQSGFGAVWDFIQPTLKTIGNGIIASFVAAYEHVKYLFGDSASGLGNIIAAGIIGGANLAIEGINSLIATATEGINQVIRLANQIPGVDISEMGTGAAISPIDNPAYRAAGEGAAQRDRNIGAAFNTDYLGGAFGAISDRARENANKPDEKEAKRLADEQKQREEALARRIEGHQQALMTEQELEMEAYEKRMDDLAAFYEGKTELDAEYREWTERAEADHAEKMVEINRQQAERENRIKDMTLSYTASMFGSLSQLASNFGEKGFLAAKAFGIAEAVINTAQGITKALATVPPPANFAAAAAVAAAGAAQIATIVSARPNSARTPTVSSGGGSYGGGFGGAAGTTPRGGSNDNALPNTAYLTIQGRGKDSWTTDEVRELADQFVALQKDGYKLVVGS